VLRGVSFLNCITFFIMRNCVCHFFPADISCSCYSSLCCIEDICCCLALEVETVLFGDIVCNMLCDFGCLFAQIFQVYTIPGFVPCR